MDFFPLILIKQFKDVAYLGIFKNKSVIEVSIYQFTREVENHKTYIYNFKCLSDWLWYSDYFMIHFLHLKKICPSSSKASYLVFVNDVHSIPNRYYTLTSGMVKIRYLQAMKYYIGIYFVFTTTITSCVKCMSKIW